MKRALLCGGEYFIADDGKPDPAPVTAWRLTRALATDLMGWPVLTDGREAGQALLSGSALVAEIAPVDGEDPIAPVIFASYGRVPWNPVENVGDAWMIIEKLGSMGFSTSIEWKGSNRIYRDSAEVSIRRGLRIAGRAEGAAAESICRAAYQAIKDPANEHAGERP